MLTEEELRHALADLCGGILTSKAAVEGRKSLSGLAKHVEEGQREEGRPGVMRGRNPVYAGSRCTCGHPLSLERGSASL